MKKNIVIFDFDGTITTKDSFNDFLIFSFGRTKIFWAFFISTPWIIGYVLGRVSNQKVKERILQIIGINMTVGRFNDLVKQYVRFCLPRLIKPKAARIIQKHIKEKATVVVVSASPFQWITLWAKSMKIDTIIASKLEVKHKHLTGRFSFNCYGKVKQKEFLKRYPDKKNYSLTVYGDSKGDEDLFAIADTIYYRSL